MLCREVRDHALELEDSGLHARDRLPEPEPLVEGDLVVAAAGRVDLRAGRPDKLREAGLDICVDVLEVLPPWEVPGLDLVAYLTESPAEGLHVLRCEDPARPEHLDVRDAPRDVVAVEAPIDGERGEEPPSGRADVAGWSLPLPPRGNRHRHSYFALFAAFTRRGRDFSPTAAHVRAGSPQT